jgi:hypothetical protein
MWYDNYSVFVLIAERGVRESFFWEQVKQRAKEEGAEAIIFFSEPDGFLTAYFVAPATDYQREQRIIIPFKQALSFILSREGFPMKQGDEEGDEVPDLPLLYTERVFAKEEEEEG